MTPDRRAVSLQKVEDELRRERAAALGRAGTQLEEAIAATEQARDVLLAAAPEEKASALQAFRAARDRARYRLWCLIVHREAVGLRSHREIDEAFPIPPPPKEG